MLSGNNFCNDKPIYVVDTNILVDYVDIVPNGTDDQPEEPTVDLSEAHLIIPSAVVRELSSFKKERNHRGKSARTVLKRIREMGEDENHSMREIYELEAPISLNNHGQMISFLPIHKNFTKCLPFHPSDNDMDGQIILAALTAAFIRKGLPIDGTADKDEVYDTVFDGVVLLTNDNGLAKRATERGLRTSRYGYKFPEPYTGRRDIVVPRELFLEFYNSPQIDLELWEEMMPSQPRLIANEFIVMKLEKESDYPSDFDLRYNPYFLHIGKYDAEERAIVHLKYINEFPVKLYNAGQAIYAEALMDPSIAAVICTGPAGSGKTYMATIYGYDACKKGKYIGVTIVPCDSHSKTGALPGGLDEKMDPEVQPIKNALRNYLLKKDPKIKRQLEIIRKYGTEQKVKNGKCGQNEDDSSEQNSVKVLLKNKVDAIWEKWFSNIPIENARGRDFSLELAFYDEFQDQEILQADTLIKRIGDEGKIIIAGDIGQIHAPYIEPSNSGLVYASRELFDTPYVAQVCFIEGEVWRHALVKLIAERQKARREQRNNPENRDG